MILILGDRDLPGAFIQLLVGPFRMLLLQNFRLAIVLAHEQNFDRHQIVVFVGAHVPRHVERRVVLRAAVDIGHRDRGNILRQRAAGSFFELTSLECPQCRRRGGIAPVDLRQVQERRYDGRLIERVGRAGASPAHGHAARERQRLRAGAGGIELRIARRHRDRVADVAGRSQVEIVVDELAKGVAHGRQVAIVEQIAALRTKQIADLPRTGQGLAARRWSWSQSTRRLRSSVPADCNSGWPAAPRLELVRLLPAPVTL